MNKFLRVLTFTLFILIFALSTVSAETFPKLFWSYETGGTVNGVAISDNGSYTAAVSDDGYLYLLNKSKKLMWKVKTENRPIKAAISSNGRMVFAGDEGAVYLYNKTGSMIWKFDAGDSVQDLAVTPNGGRIAVGSLNYYVYLLNGKGELLWEFKTDAPLMSVAISGDGKHIAAGSSRGSTYLLDKDGELLWEYASTRSIDGVGIFNGRVASGSRYINFLKDGKKAGYYTGVTCAISNIETTRDSKYMLIGCENGKIHFLGSPQKRLWSYDTKKTSLDSSISSKGGYIAVAADKNVYILTVPDATPPVVKITEPKDGATLSGIIKIGASVKESFPDTVRVLIDGDFACPAVPCTWNTGISPEGSHKITVEARDLAGNIGEEGIDITVRHTLLQNITDKISEKQDTVTDLVNDTVTDLVNDTVTDLVKDTVKEKQAAIKEKLNETTLPPNLPPLRKHRDFSPLIKAAVLLLVIYAAIKIFKRSKGRKKGGKKGRSGKYKYRR